MAKIIVKGAVGFFTCKTGKGRDRFCIKISGEARNEKGELVKVDEKHDGIITAQMFEDWDEALPKHLACILDNLCTDPMTGLKRIIKGTVKGTVTFDDSLPVTTHQGDTRVFYQVDVNDLSAFAVEPTGVEIARLKA